jgi:hypothetical protein
MNKKRETKTITRSQKATSWRSLRVYQKPKKQSHTVDNNEDYMSMRKLAPFYKMIVDEHIKGTKQTPGA